MTSLVWMWSSMKGVPCFGPSPRNTDTRARLNLAGLKMRFVPSERSSLSSCAWIQKLSGLVWMQDRSTCCMDTNSASIATKVPGRGNSSALKHSCRISAGSRRLGTFVSSDVRGNLKWRTDKDMDVSRLTMEGSIPPGKPDTSKDSSIPRRVR